MHSKEAWSDGSCVNVLLCRAATLKAARGKTGMPPSRALSLTSNTTRDDNREIERGRVPVIALLANDKTAREVSFPIEKLRWPEKLQLKELRTIRPVKENSHFGTLPCKFVDEKSLHDHTMTKTS